MWWYPTRPIMRSIPAACHRMQTVLPQEERWHARWMIFALQLPISADGAEGLQWSIGRTDLLSFLRQ